MNLSDEDLEKELAALKPAEPTPTLAVSIEEQLDEEKPAQQNTLIRFWPVLALAAAACLAIILVRPASESDNVDTPELVQQSPILPETDDPFSNYEAVEAEQRLIEAIDDGVVMVVDNEPVRRLRYQFIDSVTMVNQSDGSVFTMEIPREETLFVPVTLL